MILCQVHVGHEKWRVRAKHLTSMLNRTSLDFLRAHLICIARLNCLVVPVSLQWTKIGRTRPSLILYHMAAKTATQHNSKAKMWISKLIYQLMRHPSESKVWSGIVYDAQRLSKAEQCKTSNSNKKACAQQHQEWCGQSFWCMGRCRWSHTMRKSMDTFDLE